MRNIIDALGWPEGVEDVEFDPPRVNIVLRPAEFEGGPGMSDYDADILVWSERQAALLRRRAAGELVNEAEIDWSNVAEEIESLGKNHSRELASRIAAVLL